MTDPLAVQPKVRLDMGEQSDDLHRTMQLLIDSPGQSILRQLAILHFPPGQFPFEMDFREPLVAIGE